MIHDLIILALPFGLALVLFLVRERWNSGYALVQEDGDEAPRVIAVPSDPA